MKIHTASRSFKKIQTPPTMAQENLDQIGLVLEEVIKDLELISQEDDFIQISNPDLTSSIANALHYSKEAASRYLEALRKTKPDLAQKVNDHKIETRSKFIQYCLLTEKAEDIHPQLLR